MAAKERGYLRGGRGNKRGKLTVTMYRTWTINQQKKGN